MGLCLLLFAIKKDLLSHVYVAYNNALYISIYIYIYIDTYLLFHHSLYICHIFVCRVSTHTCRLTSVATSLSVCVPFWHVPLWRRQHLEHGQTERMTGWSSWQRGWQWADHTAWCGMITWPATLALQCTKWTHTHIDSGWAHTFTPAHYTWQRPSLGTNTHTSSEWCTCLAVARMCVIE